VNGWGTHVNHRVCRSRRRGGFALPLVVLLTVIAGILLAAMLDRFGTQQTFAQRQLEQYRDHHIARGLQEAMQAWVNSIDTQTQSLKASLGERGKAFDLELDGQRVTVYLEDGQGTALAEFAGLTTDEMRVAAEVLDQLQKQDRQEARQLIRREGPLAVSVKAADERVLMAVARACCDSSRASRVVTEVLRVRDDEEFTIATMAEAFTKAAVEGEERVKLMQMLVTEPTLYRGVAEAPRQGGGVIRYTFNVLIPSGANRARMSGGVTRPMAVMDWQRDRSADE
jgi:type II secretory pathway pseudopilin PulG